MHRVVLRSVHQEAPISCEVPLAHQLRVRAELVLPQVVAVGAKDVAEVPVALVPQCHDDVDGAASKFFMGGAPDDMPHFR